MLLLGGGVGMSTWAGDNTAGSEVTVIIAERIPAPPPRRILRIAVFGPGGETALCHGASRQEESLTDVYICERWNTLRPLSTSLQFI